MSVILITTQNPTASGFETQGAVGPSSMDLGLPIHEGITRDGLYFLKSDPLESIVSQHVKIEQLPASPNHFDNCQFDETVVQINARYDAAILDLNPTSPNLPQAEENFGYILHAAQDFYAHTNWVEMGRTDLIDPWLGHWKPLYGYTNSSNTPSVFILEEGSTPHPNFQIYKTGKVITVSNPLWNFTGKMGLISGTYDADVNKCPASASIPHGGKISTIINRVSPDESRDLPNELNKDNPAMRGHWIARTLAVQQTTHEFCRLLDLEKAKYGDVGVKFVNDHWVQDQYLIDSPANNSRCPTSDPTQVGMIQDSSTSTEQKVAAIPSSSEKNNVSSDDLNKQCQTNYGAGAYYDSTQNVCFPPGGDWSNPGIAYLTLQCQTNYGAGAYYDSTQNVCFPPGGDWSNPGIAYLTLQCQTNYGAGAYYDSTQKICLPPSGSWVTSTTAPSTPLNETQTATTTTCPNGETLDPVTNKCTNTELAPKQVTISNDALISLYKTSKQYEKATSSLLTLNDNQENALHGLAESSWYKNSTDTKNAVHAQVVDLMIEKQSIDKKNIQNVSDWMKKISDKIKEYAQKQGTDPSILEQIDSEMQYEDHSRNASPVVGLRQSADDANTNVNAANNEKMTLDNNKEMPILGTVGLGIILGNDSIVEQFRLLTQEGIRVDDPSLVQMAETILKEHRDELSKSEIEFINSYLEPFVSPVSPNENLFDQIEKYINSLNGNEQKETDSILNQISDSGMGELSPIEKTPPQLLSKHGTYEPSANSNSQSELYDVFVTWVLKSQSGVEYKSAHMLATNHQTGSIGILDLPIVDGVIQFNAPHVEPGTYDFKLTKIDGLPSPADNMIEIIIPHRQIESSTPQSTIQSTPNVPSTPPQDMPPALSVPQQVIQEATSSSGAIVQFTVEKASPIPAIITCDHESGSQFPIGTTVVTCTAIGETDTVKKSFTVTVRDTTGPAISPFNPHNDTPDDSGAIVYFTAEAIDLVDGSVTVHCDHESGTKFPLGTTIVTCTADDSKGNHSERKLGITITKS